jgi:hypothetical protein
MSTQNWKRLAYRGLIDKGVAQSAGAFEVINTIHKFGYNPSITSTEETIWDHGGIYGYPGSAQVMRYTSGSSLDTATTGPGAWTLQVYGVDSAWNAATETITLDGHNVVSGAVLFNRMNRAIVRTAGTSAQNVGEIFAASGANTAGVPDNQAEIHTTVGSANGQTLQSFYTIPANTDGYMKSFYISTAGNATPKFTVDIRAREPGEIFVIKDRIKVTAGAPASVVLPNGAKFPEKTDIEIRAIADSGTAEITAIFDLTLVSSGGGL